MTGVEVRVFDASLGAEVRGVDLDRPITDAVRAHILELVAEHVLVVFRGHAAPPANEAYVRFGERFGPLRASVADLSRLRDHEDINLVSNTVEADGVTGTGGAGVIEWHADMNFGVPATDYIALDAIELPSDGGTTKFTNLCRAFDALDRDVRAAAERAEVRYTFRPDLDYAKLSPEQLASLPSVTHGLTQRRAPGRRPSLWPNVGIFDGTVPDGDTDDGVALLDTCFAHAVSAEFVYEHHWEPGDLALWSNWCTFHRREPFDPDQRRVMRHLTISEGGPAISETGTRPVR